MDKGRLATFDFCELTVSDESFNFKIDKAVFFKVIEGSIVDYISKRGLKEIDLIIENYLNKNVGDTLIENKWDFKGTFKDDVEHFISNKFNSMISKHLNKNSLLHQVKINKILQDNDEQMKDFINNELANKLKERALKLGKSNE